MSTNRNNAIKVEGLKKSYGSTVVLRGIDFTVRRGSMLALLGPNGAGKTTIVRILSTLLNFDGGSIIIDNINLAKQPDKIRNRIGLTGQSAAVDELLTGRENLLMMGRLYRLTKQSAVSRAKQLLHEFDLEAAADRPVRTYSGGMRRRLDLAVSLIAVPPIIFLDEPTTGLDPRSRNAMWDIIRDLMKNGTTILLTTQYLEEADRLADEIILIDEGKVIANGTPKELKRKIGNDTLELTFKTDTSYRSAKAALSNKLTSSDNDIRSISISLNKTNRDVREALDTLANASIDFDNMSVHKPSLDDVFLSLTNKSKDGS